MQGPRHDYLELRRESSIVDERVALFPEDQLVDLQVEPVGMAPTIRWETLADAAGAEETRETYSFRLFLSVSSLLERSFLAARNPRGLLQFGDPSSCSLSPVYGYWGWSTNLLLVAAATKPEAIVKIVPSLAASLLATDPSGDVLHTGPGWSFSSLVAAGSKDKEVGRIFYLLDPPFQLHTTPQTVRSTNRTAH